MGYPTSVSVFSAKNAGDVIQPAHVNDLQTEVSAIETGLLNGLSHSFAANAGLQSSNSTVNALSVSSLSTFAYRPTVPAPDAVRLSLAANSTHSNTTRAISWTVQDFMTNSSLHSTTTNPSRITPQSTGLYQIHCGARSNNAQAASTFQFDLYVEDSSGTRIALDNFQQAVNVGQTTPAVHAFGLKRFDSLAATPYVRAVIQCSVADEVNSADAFFELWKLF